MSDNPIAQFQERLRQLSPKHDQYAVEVVQLLLETGRLTGASDLHLLPQAEGRYAILWRIDGVLHPVATLPLCGPNIVARLKVLAELLTYRMDVPQEGRLRGNAESSEVRVSTFPTIHGEKAVVRLFAETQRFQLLDDLGLPLDICGQLRELLLRTAGAIIVSGPSGSGKTTTLYACLRTMLSNAHNTTRSIATLEDPVECLIPGVAQTQIQSGKELTYARGLSSLMRQDPDVILVGEIRDHLTAETVFQAALTGHLILTTFHAGRAVDAISRLLDMRLEPYVVSSGLQGILSQRLLRKLCACATPDNSSAGHPHQTGRHTPDACETCGGTGYFGRILLAEMLIPEELNLGSSVVERVDTRTLAERALQAGLIPFEARIQNAIGEGLTSKEEVWRVFGGQTAVESK